MFAHSVWAAPGAKLHHQIHIYRKPVPAVQLDRLTLLANDMCNPKLKDVGRGYACYYCYCCMPSSPVLLHIYCPHPLSCCIYTALVFLLFGTIIPTSFNILMLYWFFFVYSLANTMLFACVSPTHFTACGHMKCT